jgi:UDP-N-acetylglucosamine--N-acetylmuramyl-(pentapeptide) pyrophosphoryl-undecaprenol N-acetylglucosamine transferase
MSRFLIACGGTGGHLSPGIALAESLLARGHAATLFISRKQVDTRLIEKYPHLRAERVAGAPFAGRPDLFARFVAKQSAGFVFSLRHLRRARPDVVVGFGGFTNAGVVFAGRSLGVPVALHEANRVPGRAIRLLSHFADRLYLPPGVRLPGRLGLLVQHTGLPVRAEIAREPREAACRALGLDPQQRVLVVLGGSQGSEPLNQWVEQHLPVLAAEGVQVYCVTGLGKGAEGVRELSAPNGRVVRAVFRAFSDKVGTLLSAADLVLSRAGAGTLAEMVRCGTPGILVPYPQAADNHQQANARYFEAQGGGLVVPQTALPTLLQEVRDVIGNEWLLAKFRVNLRRMAQENTIETIVRDLERLAAHPGRADALRPAASGQAA